MKVSLVFLGLAISSAFGSDINTEYMCEKTTSILMVEACGYLVSNYDSSNCTFHLRKTPQKCGVVVNLISRGPCVSQSGDMLLVDISKWIKIDLCKDPIGTSYKLDYKKFNLQNFIVLAKTVEFKIQIDFKCCTTDPPETTKSLTTNSIVSASSSSTTIQILTSNTVPTTSVSTTTPQILTSNTVPTTSVSTTTPQILTSNTVLTTSVSTTTTQVLTSVTVPITSVSTTTAKPTPCMQIRPKNVIKTCPDSGNMEITNSVRLTGTRDAGPENCTIQINLGPDHCQIFFIPLTELPEECTEEKKILVHFTYNINGYDQAGLLRLCYLEANHTYRLIKKTAKLEILGRLNYELNIRIQCCSDKDNYSYEYYNDYLYEGSSEV